MPPRIPRLIEQVDCVEWHNGGQTGYVGGLRSAEVCDYKLPADVRLLGTEIGPVLALDGDGCTVRLARAFVRNLIEYPDGCYGELRSVGPYERV